MLSEEKIKKMIRLSEFETGQGETDLVRTSYRRLDYIRLRRLESGVSVFVACMIAVGLAIAYHMDTIQENILHLRVMPILILAGLLIVLVMAVAMIITTRISGREYDESETRVKEYETTLNELMEIYNSEKEEQAVGGSTI